MFKKLLLWQSNQRREFLDIHSQQDVEQFAYDWIKSKKNELAYRASTVNVEKCEVDVLAVAEKKSICSDILYCDKYRTN